MYAAFMARVYAAFMEQERAVETGNRQCRFATAPLSLDNFDHLKTVKEGLITIFAHVPQLQQSAGSTPPTTIKLPLH